MTISQNQKMPTLRSNISEIDKIPSLIFLPLGLCVVGNQTTNFGFGYLIYFRDIGMPISEFRKFGKLWGSISQK